MKLILLCYRIAINRYNRDVSDDKARFLGERKMADISNLYPIDEFRDDDCYPNPEIDLADLQSISDFYPNTDFYADIASEMDLSAKELKITHGDLIAVSNCFTEDFPIIPHIHSKFIDFDFSKIEKPSDTSVEYTAIYAIACYIYPEKMATPMIYRRKREIRNWLARQNGEPINYF
jgi:hypothetical protein